MTLDKPDKLDIFECISPMNHPIEDEDITKFRKFLNIPTRYHDPTSCNKCGGENDVSKHIRDEHGLSEAQTECLTCGHKDYWAYGYFEGNDEFPSKCDTYQFSPSWSEPPIPPL